MSARAPGPGGGASLRRGERPAGVRGAWLREALRSPPGSARWLRSPPPKRRGVPCARSSRSLSLRGTGACAPSPGSPAAVPLRATVIARAGSGGPRGARAPGPGGGASLRRGERPARVRGAWLREPLRAPPGSALWCLRAGLGCLPETWPYRHTGGLGPFMHFGRVRVSFWPLIKSPR